MSFDNVRHRPHISDMAKHPKRPRDPNQLAKLIVGIASGNEADAPPPKASAAAELGRRSVASNP
ncbi:hypothetical protein [Desertibaculum subflavum]|uniref:hypothetical protein n=1 Tax=Desertibaculum subflavum TaxID=2268458 RepID=UPI0013C4E642